MALDFLALQTEVYARGFDYLESLPNRVARFVNDAMHEIDSQDDWLYLHASTSGTAPLVISDLDTVLSVFNSDDNLALVKSDGGSLNDQYGDLTETGYPSFFYLTDGNTINVFPAKACTLTVAYYRVSDDLSIDADTPLMPDRFRQSIVEYACAKAYLDSDNPEMASQCRAEGDRIIQLMRDSQTDAQGYIVVRGQDGW